MRPAPPDIARMFVLIVGCGRVGSAIAKRMITAGHEVSVLDESPEAHALLDHGLDQTWEDARRPVHGRDRARGRCPDRGRHRAGRRGRLLDRRRQHEHRRRADREEALPGAEGASCACSTPTAPSGTSEQGLHTVCPTQVAIEMLTRGRDRRAAVREPLMEEAR